MSHHRILVVDDEEEIRQLFVDILVPKGYEVIAAASGPEAIAHARERPFDLVFLDIKMPGMNGVEAFEALRSLHPGAHYVMITGYAGSHLVDKSLAEGALLCLSKPFGVADILDLVRSLERQQAAA
ncbi:MAG TPA: response regulator [Armatimonadota bacterium]|nr:response regulator [Armatimonadota bacterium]